MKLIFIIPLPFEQATNFCQGAVDKTPRHRLFNNTPNFFNKTPIFSEIKAKKAGRADGGARAGHNVNPAALWVTAKAIICPFFGPYCGDADRSRRNDH